MSRKFLFLFFSLVLILIVAPKAMAFEGQGSGDEERRDGDNDIDNSKSTSTLNDSSLNKNSASQTSAVSGANDNSATNESSNEIENNSEAVAMESSEKPSSLPAIEQTRTRPATQSLTLGLGGAANLMGGWAYPKIGLKGAPNNGFYGHGRGGAFKLLWDFPAWDLDWRLGIDGTLPGYMGFEATAGIRKDLSPWSNPRLIARGGAGLEMILAGGQKNTVYLLPVVVGKGEVALEFTLVPNTLAIGAGVEVGVKYGIPLGVGFDLGSTARISYWF